MTISEKLAKLRAIQGINQKQLAPVLGISGTYLSQIARGRTPSDTVSILIDCLLNSVVLKPNLMEFVEAAAKRNEMRSASEYVEYLVRRERDKEGPMITLPVPKGLPPKKKKRNGQRGTESDLDQTNESTDHE